MYQNAGTYIDLASETANILFEEMTAANRRALSYVSSLFEIAKTPQPTDPQSFLREGLERAESVMTLTLKEVETSIKSGAGVVEKLLAQSKKLQQVGS
jgi:hypothetical protein